MALVVACSAPAATHVTRPAIRDAGAPAPLGEPECDALVDHAIDLLRPGIPDATRAELRAVGTSCRELSRSAYACAMAATTLDAFVACDSAQP